MRAILKAAGVLGAAIPAGQVLTVVCYQESYPRWGDGISASVMRWREACSAVAIACASMSSSLSWAVGPLWVKVSRTQYEYMSSALPPQTRTLRDAVSILKCAMKGSRLRTFSKAS